MKTLIRLHVALILLVLGSREILYANTYIESINSSERAHPTFFEAYMAARKAIVHKSTFYICDCAYSIRLKYGGGWVFRFGSSFKPTISVVVTKDGKVECKTEEILNPYPIEYMYPKSPEIDFFNALAIARKFSGSEINWISLSSTDTWSFTSPYCGAYVDLSIGRGKFCFRIYNSIRVAARPIEETEIEF